MVGIGIIGCGFVADLYMRALGSKTSLKVVAACDRQAERADRFQQFWSVPAGQELGFVLDNAEVELVLNLTNPDQHYIVSKACLEAGKHVYSEKPFAMVMAEAEELAALAAQRGLHLSAAPCNLLSESAQTLWRAVRQGAAGPVRVVYAELDDGFVPLAPYRKWLSESGVPWPAEDEFAVGCTMEHAGYYLTWLLAMFGPVRSVTSFASVQYPDKPSGDQPNAPDFSVATLHFKSGVVARLTCTIITPHDHRIRIFGDTGILQVDDCWFYDSRPYLRRWLTLRRRHMLSPFRTRFKLADSKLPRAGTRGAAAMDFARGPEEMAKAIRSQPSHYLRPDFCLHVNELTLAIQNAGSDGGTQLMRTDFVAPEPMPWAR